MSEVSHNRPKWTDGYVDATEPITINIKRRDVEDSQEHPLDGRRCTVACCLGRALSAELAFVYKTVAYVQFDSDQAPIRYEVPNRLRRQVVDPLDQGRLDDIVIGQYALQPPKPSRRKEAIVKMNRQSRERNGPKKRGPRQVPYAPRHVLTRVSMVARSDWERTPEPTAAQS